MRLSGLDGLFRQFAKVFYDFAQQLDTLFIAVSVPRWGRVCKREIDALQSNCIKFAVLNLERTEIIPVPVATSTGKRKFFTDASLLISETTDGSTPTVASPFLR
jgi:hypothetical protein